MTDEFAPDEFMATVAIATGKVYPTPGAMQYANRLAEEYGEELVMKAIGYVITRRNAQPHEVLGMAEEALKYRAEKQRMAEAKEKDKEREQARLDREARERQRFEELAQNFQPVGAERVAEIMGDWAKRTGKTEP